MVSQPDTSVSTVSSSRSRAAALEWLQSRINYEQAMLPPYGERQLKLDRMRTLLMRLGQPDAGLKIVHVAGTKGKGSTSAMLASILTAAGYRTGVFSSPHLTQIEERFAIDGASCTAVELATLVDRLRPICQAMDEEDANSSDPVGGPTYFEVTTAIALLHFVERQADAAILEVGLGGRLDATNVCLPVVSVITSISFDHMRQLGNTLASIAREKAGIIKPGVPVVCGVEEPEAQRAIAEIAREHGSRLIQAGEDFSYQYRSSQLDFQYAVAGQDWRLDQLALGMRGRHQAANGAVALATIAELGHQDWCISTDAIRTGLQGAVLPARVEYFASQSVRRVAGVEPKRAPSGRQSGGSASLDPSHPNRLCDSSGRPAVVIDTAHNQASARALVAALNELPPHGRRTLILSVSSDKDVQAILQELVPHFERVIVTQYQNNPRAVPAAELADFVDAELIRRAVSIKQEILVCETPRAAWEAACAVALADELVVVAGSFFLAAELRPNLLGG